MKTITKFDGLHFVECFFHKEFNPQDFKAGETEYFVEYFPQNYTKAVLKLKKSAFMCSNCYFKLMERFNYIEDEKDKKEMQEYLDNFKFITELKIVHESIKPVQETMLGRFSESLNYILNKTLRSDDSFSSKKVKSRRSKKIKVKNIKVKSRKKVVVVFILKN